MNVTLYRCSSGSNVLNKTLEALSEAPVTARAKGNVDIDQPTLILSYASTDFNYFYVAEFDRYYNVLARSLQPGSEIVVTGISDPLQSFASGIENIETLIVRAEDPELRNRYIADSSIPIPSDPQFEVIEGDEIIPALSAGNYVIGVV